MKILLTTRREPSEPRNPIALLDLAPWLRALGHQVECFFTDRAPAGQYDLVGLSALRAVGNEPDEDALALQERFQCPVMVGGKWAGTASASQRAALESRGIELWAGPGELRFHPGPIDYAHYPSWQECDFATLGEVHYEVMSSRGCAYHCNFCHNTEDRIWFFSPKRTADHVELLLRSGVKEIFFVDDIFAANPRHMTAIQAELDRRGLSLAHRCTFFTHVNFINPRTLACIEAFQPTSVQIGIESGDDGMLRAMGKAFTSAKAFRAIEQLHRRCQRVVGLFLVGYPGETEESLQHTLGFIERARPMLQYVWVSYYQPVPSTVGFEQAVKRDPAFKGGRSNRDITYLDPNLNAGTLVKYRFRMMNASSPHAIVAFFERNDFRSYALLRDLVKEFGQPNLFILWHHYDADSPVEVAALERYNCLLEAEILDFIAQTYEVTRSRLDALLRDYPLFLKILLLLYARRFLGLDYCIMTDNDLVALEPLTEIVDLSSRHIPFLIRETGTADQSPRMLDFISARLGKPVHYRPPANGGGYNIGFCGIDLTVFDSLNAEQFSGLLDLFGQMSEWWRDQLFLVPMIFTSPRPVHVFDNQRYQFLPFDDFSYPEKSKIYHAIFTHDKSGVDLLYSIRHGKLNARRYLAIIDHVRACPCQRILEIGVCAGDTSELLLLNSRNPSVEYHGIDLFEDADDALRAREVSLKADALADVQARLSRVSRHVHLHKGFSHDVAARLQAQGLRFDMIWIDGGHAYETVRQDFLDCLPLLNEGGVIFFDDYTEDSYLPDVKRFIDAELLHEPGLTVTIHQSHVDRYRGFDFKVVSARRKTALATANPDHAPKCPPAGFYFHLLGRHNQQDLPWEAPYLLAEARFCLERKACLEYACYLVNLARPFLSPAQVLGAVRLMVEQGVCREEAVRLLDHLGQALEQLAPKAVNGPADLKPNGRPRQLQAPSETAPGARPSPGAPSLNWAGASERFAAGPPVAFEPQPVLLQTTSKTPDAVKALFQQSATPGKLFAPSKPDELPGAPAGAPVRTQTWPPGMTQPSPWLKASGQPALAAGQPNGAAHATVLPGSPYQRVLLPLDYPPSRALRPRWGHGRLPHQGLVRLFSAWHGEYLAAVRELRELLPFFAAIKPAFTNETAPEPGWVGGPITALDLALLYYFIWKHRPATYIEIGSGVTTCFARRAIQDHRLQTRLLSIDPEPRAAIDAICDEVVRDGLETLPDLDLFGALEPGDIVFVDGSHRAFMNSDVTVFMLDVLPRLKPGVLIHFHDIHLPCDYDPQFLHWYWNEQYMVATHLLAAWQQIRVLMPSYYLATTPGLNECLRPALLPGLDPLTWQHGGSLWFTHTQTGIPLTLGQVLEQLAPKAGARPADHEPNGRPWQLQAPPETAPGARPSSGATSLNGVSASERRLDPQPVLVQTASIAPDPVKALFQQSATPGKCCAANQPDELPCAPARAPAGTAPHADRVGELFEEFRKLGESLATGGPEQAVSVPFVIDLNGDLLRLPADLLRFLWHTYTADHSAVVPAFLAETEHYHWIQQRLHPGEIAFDIGASLGMFTTMMAKAVGPNGQVHAFEPNPSTASDLRRMLAVNGVNNVIVNQCALAERAGSAEFVDIRAQNVQREASHLVTAADAHAGSGPAQQRIQVQTMTVDEYVSQQRVSPGLLKIDVEGADLPVLKGAARTMRELHPLVVLEIHYFNPEFFEELHALLAAAGYQHKHEGKIYYCQP